MELPDIEGVVLYEHWDNPKYAVREGEWVVVLPHRVDLYRGNTHGKKVMEINHDGTKDGIESAVRLALGVK